MNTENTAQDTTVTDESQEVVLPASETVPVQKKRRGFAAMDRSKVASIASKGGKAAHAAGTAHRFSTEEARAAGKKGGLAPRAKRQAKGIHGSSPTEGASQVDNHAST